MRAAWLLCLLVLTACPSPLRRPASTQLVMAGTITIGGLERRGDALEGAHVALRDGDSGALLAENVTSATGGYRLSAAVTQGQRVVFAAWADGHAPALRSLTVGPSTELTLSVALEPLEPFDCEDVSCGPLVDDFTWVNPPADSSGVAVVSDVTVAPDVTVPRSADREQLLALSFVDVTVADGGAADPGEWRLRLAPPAWPFVRDAVPDSGVVEVAAATIDETTGAWRALAPAPLLTEAGLPFPESALPALAGGTFTGGAVAVLPVGARGWVGLFGAPGQAGCIEGSVVAEGKPAEGVSVLIPGSEPTSTDTAGGFCLAAPVGGALATTRLHYAGLYYQAPGVPRPTAAAKCGGDCARAGTLEVSAEKQLTARACEVTGTVVDGSGALVPEAVVVGYDETLSGNAFTALCGDQGKRCRLVSVADAQGAFRLVLPVASEVRLTAQAVQGVGTALESQRLGDAREVGCPKDPVTVTLTRGRERLTVSASFSGDTLSWVPPRAATRVVVTDSTGGPKWELESVAGMKPPLTLGQVPAAATELTALTGAAASGDELSVLLIGADAQGVYEGSATATRP